MATQGAAVVNIYIVFIAFFLLNAGVYANKIYVSLREYERPGILRTTAGQLALTLVALMNITGGLWLCWMTVSGLGWLYLGAMIVVSAVSWVLFAAIMTGLVGPYFVALAPTVTYALSAVGLVVCDWAIYVATNP
jgi:hypothetical protein